jgi:hypothetical protein
MKPRSAPPRAYQNIEVVRLIWLAIFISVFSFLFYNRHGDVLLYGDAVAHINIARRVFDSRTPGLLQLGTVWLPLPHLLIMPFIVSKDLWQTGMGGSIPSMAGFVLGTLGIFRLLRNVLSGGLEVTTEVRITSWTAAIIYAANPNLIYMQATAMGESLYLAFFVWAVAYFAEFARGNAEALLKCGMCLAAACLTRYDGWFLAAVLVVAAIVRFCFVKKINDVKKKPQPVSAGTLAKFVLIASTAPILWLTYNAMVYRNALEFLNGPYSAKAIEQKTNTVNPAKGSLLAAESYFIKAAELDVSESNWGGRVWLALALLGSASAIFDKRLRMALLLWSPALFYALSLAYGSVPIFVPSWWPFSLYNLRYGLQLLPAFAVFVPLGILFLIKRAMKIDKIGASVQPWVNTITVSAILLIAATSYAAIWRVNPICYREASENMRSLIALDRQVGEWLKSLPPNSTLLMYLGEHSGALERVGIPLKRTINEGNHRVWKRPADPEGLWESALADPAESADFAVAYEGDPVWNAARNRNLTAFVEIHTTGQPSAVIFETRKPAPAANRGNQ